MKTSLLCVILIGSSFRLTAQVPAIGRHCAARVCEESTIYAVAIDSVLRRPHVENSAAPRILKRLYLVPFHALRTQAPMVGVLDEFSDGSTFRRFWRAAQILDSAQIVGPDGHTLSPGGPLIILSPIDWLAEDAARLQLAEYPRDMYSGGQLFVFLRRGPRGWYVREISVGAMN